MAQDCFLTFGIRRQMIMMQPGKLSILPLESKQWGYTTYNSNPNGQAIVPAISFNTFFAGFVTDTGIKWNTGGTFAGLSYENNVLIFWPQYTGAPQTVSKNGTNYHWLIFCM